MGALMQLKAVRPRPFKYLSVFTMADIAVNRISAFLSRLLRNEWRDIASAPFDREIEVATIDEDINVPGASCLRHGDAWLDAESLRPVEITATHWRYRRPVMLPVSCC